MLCWGLWKCIQLLHHLDICRLECQLLVAVNQGVSPKKNKVHTFHWGSWIRTFLEGTFAMHCFLLVSRVVPLCTPHATPRLTVGILAVKDGVVKVRFRDITWLWFWTGVAVPRSERYELESWQARMERMFLSPPRVVLSFPFKLEWPHSLDTDTSAPETCRS